MQEYGLTMSMHDSKTSLPPSPFQKEEWTKLFLRILELDHMKEGRLWLLYLSKAKSVLYDGGLWLRSMVHDIYCLGTLELPHTLYFKTYKMLMDGFVSYFQSKPAVRRDMERNAARRPFLLVWKECFSVCNIFFQEKKIKNWISWLKIDILERYTLRVLYWLVKNGEVKEVLGKIECVIHYIMYSFPAWPVGLFGAILMTCKWAKGMRSNQIWHDNKVNWTRLNVQVVHGWRAR